jgi:hypothetical protein
MIIGRDLLEELGMSLDFGQHIVTWDNATVTMKDSSTINQLLNDKNSFFWHEELAETETLKSATERLN